ncbi:lipopolysaccharide assembly protein LapB [Aureispira sp. CCB-QB1]|uniref:tetratricopeptide repeat protein n=1 Tax=Aureispira sp. CCB-QB1 TaxID=1313421 RepID=UPI0006990F0A|nr:tetratricopeptide repeat protein [Aureispira sp. CCB-QB1]
MSFTKQEITQLSNLLLSPEDTNKSIALGLIQNSPQVVNQLQIPLTIVAYLSNDNQAHIEGLAHDLLIQNLPEACVRDLQDQILILNYAQYKFKVVEGWNTYKNPLRLLLELHENAIEKYMPFFRINPAPYAKIYTLLANRIKNEWNNYQKVLFFYEKAMELDPDNTQASFGFASIVHTHYIKKGQRLEDVDRVLNYYIRSYKTPRNIVSYRNAALLCQDIGAIQRAVHYYEEGLKLCPDDTILLNNYANLLMHPIRDYHKAQAFAARGLDILPHDPSLLDTMANIQMYGFRNYEKAEQLFFKVIQKGDEHHYSFTGLGDLYLRMQDYDKAEKYYLKGLHNGLQYTSREIHEIILKLKKIVRFYAHYLNDSLRAEHYYHKLVRLKNKTH